MTIGAINSVSNNYSNLSFGENLINAQTTNNKPKMSTTTKVILGTSLAALAAIGIYIATRGKAKPKTGEVIQSAQEAAESLKNLKYRKPEKAGENVQETINNILGKNSGITPHSYDTSKEFPAIAVYRSTGGYKDGFVTPDGILESTENAGRFLNTANSHGVDKAEEILGNKIARIIIKDPNGVEYKITFISPNQEYTPLQLDVIKLIQHPEKIDSKVFNKITDFVNIIDENGHYLPNFAEINGKYANLDYDLILSAVQSMAKGL